MPYVEPNQFAIELRDKDGNLKKRLEDRATSVGWEWLANGGCGRAKIGLDAPYNWFLPEADDDLRIYLPDGSGATELVYRGVLENFSRELNGKSQKIELEFDGYKSWFDRIVVHDNTDEKVYEFMEMSAIAEAIMDDFIIPNITLTKGTIQEGQFAADRIEFKGTAADAFRTLAELQGRVVYGVGPDLVFYWYNEVDTVGDDNKWFLGEHVTDVRDRTDWRNMKNDIFFEGGKVNDATFVTRQKSQSSIDLYGLRQSIESKGSISTTAVAQRFMRTILKQEGIPRRQVTCSLVGHPRRPESSLPIGKIQIIDPDVYQDPIRYRDAADPEVITYGVGDYVYGECEEHFVDRIRYSLNPQDGAYDIEVQFGDSLGVSLASAQMKRMENLIDANRQRSL